ncbi:hypothetical protein [Brachybacterium sp. 107]|uniref:hypothetical protein n=1 Tax=Brachybacterium sp. 107 TaxID=3457736 RepID=UPI00403333F8
MDWTNAAVAALVSAAISGAVGVFFSSRTAVAEMRAREREDARRQVVILAQDLQRRILAHQDSGNPRGRRIGTRIEIDDLSTAWQVVQPIRTLGRFRRRHAMNLARRIFGVWVVNRVRVMKDDSGESAFSAWVRDAVRLGDAPIVTGSWHKALSAPANSPELTLCLRDLRRLERV